MAIKLIADPHGCFEGLGDKVTEEDTLLVLGDVLDLIDWADISGILPDVLGRDNFTAKLFSALRDGPEAAVALRDELLSPQSEYHQELFRRTRDQYVDFARSLRELGCRSYVIYGNGDMPDLLSEVLRSEENAILAQGRVEIDGILFGFVNGALHSPFQMPAEMDEEDYGELLREVGDVDVLCTHIPPRVKELTMDVVAGRPVEGSSSLLEYLGNHRPSYLYHGHVHQPAQRGLRLGDTLVINVAYYKRQRYVHVHGDDDGI